jgi:hypothetical protein
VVLQREEISEYRMVSLDKALTMLRAPIKRRVRAACAAKSTVYLEEGRQVDHVLPG